MLKKLVIMTLPFLSITATAETQPPQNQYNQFYSYYQDKAKEIVNKMTLEEKIGQMTLVSISQIKNEKEGLNAIEKYNIGAILADGNDMPATPSLSDWQALSRIISSHTASTQHIPLLLGTDAVHGNQHVANAVIFPHNIGLGATHDTQLIHQIAAWTAYDVKLSGFNWAFAPTVAVVHDFRWGRTYESFGSNPNWIQNFAREYVLGAQNIDNTKHILRGVLTSTKHFMADGNTDNGIDEGNVTTTNNEQLRNENYPGYIGAFSAGTGSVMISYSSINHIPLSVNKFYLDSYLFKKDTLDPHFDGFTVSDYAAISKAARGKPFHETLANSINAGMDMIMVGQGDLYYINNDPALIDHSASLSAFQAAILYDVNLSDQDPYKISQQRIDEAVTHILQVKLAMGLFNSQQPKLIPPQGDENKIALQAAEESLVLLKNDQKGNTPAIPITAKIKHILLLSPPDYSLYDDIGTQCGGWTIKWQGMRGNKYTDENASSILTGLKKLAPANVYINANEPLLIDEYTSSNTIAIALLAEPPYTEFMGDVDNDDNGFYEINHNQLENGLFMQFDDFTLTKIKRLKEKNIPIITVLISGRPMIINHLLRSGNDSDAPLNISDAFIAAWLPGTKGGEAIANAIFGNYHFRNSETANTLPFPWPKDIKQVKTGRLVCDSIRKDSDPVPMYECGYGLAT